MSDWREIAYEADRDSGSEYGGEDFDTEIARLRARIRELEKIIHERDLDIVELAEDRNEWIVAGAAESRRAAEAERKLADRDAAWERAIRDELNDEMRLFDTEGDFIAAIRQRVEAEGGAG